MALPYRATVDQPQRFVHSRAVGAHVGLTPRRHQSGEIDFDGGISKSGDAMLRTMLYEAAQVLLTQSRHWSWLKAWGMKVAQRRDCGAPSSPSHVAWPSYSTVCGRTAPTSAGAANPAPRSLPPDTI